MKKIRTFYSKYTAILIWFTKKPLIFLQASSSIIYINEIECNQWKH